MFSDIPQVIVKEIQSYTANSKQQDEIKSIVHKAILLERERCKKALVQNLTAWLLKKIEKIK